MNVLIVATNRNQHPVPVMPFGACIIAEAADMAEHNVSLLDLMFERDPLSAITNALKAGNPDVVGLSIRNIDNNNMRHPISFPDELAPLMNAIRTNTRAKIVLGGAAVSIMPEEYLRLTGADYAVIGNGEKIFNELLSALHKKKSVAGIPGLAWLENNILHKTSPNDPAQNPSISPRFERWINVGKYLSNFSPAPIQSKRGCPYDCVYCTYAISEGRNYQLREPEYVANCVRELVNSGISDIEFVDNVFNSPYQHALSICEAIIKSKVKARLHTIELNPKFIDDKLLEKMEEAGFASAGVTVESASDIVLKGLKKGFTGQDVHRAAKFASRTKIPLLWIFMIGGPGETESSVLETLSFAERHIRKTDTAIFNVGVRIYPGTELEVIARKQGQLNLSTNEMFRPVSYVSPQIDQTWLNFTMEQTMKKNLNFVNVDSLAFPFLGTIQRLGYLLGFRPPVWKHTRFLRRGLNLLGMKV